jgi:hypothetical protein
LCCDFVVCLVDNLARLCGVVLLLIGRLVVESASKENKQKQNAFLSLRNSATCRRDAHFLDHHSC